MAIPRSFIEKIKSDVSIVKIAEKLFNLKKEGPYYKASCLHGEDKNPSLVFYTENNSFYCFTCQAGSKYVTGGSDNISLVMWVKNISFQEAVEFIASIENWEIPTDKNEEEYHRKIKLIYKMAMNYNSLLLKNEQLLSYLKSRYLSEEDIQKWMLGYSSNLKNGRKNRLAIPIQNKKGHILSFSYREVQSVLGHEKEEPKYLNMPNHDLFKKQNHLYGIHSAIPLSKTSSFFILNEGFFDVIRLQSFDFPAVSIMGTSLSDSQIELLKEYTSHVVVWMDGDEAGIKATHKHCNDLIKEGFYVEVIISKNIDPDEKSREFNDKEAFWKWFEKEKMPYVLYLVKSKLNEYEKKHHMLQHAILSDIDMIVKEVSSVKERLIIKAMVEKSLGISFKETKTPKDEES